SSLVTSTSRTISTSSASSSGEGVRQAAMTESPRFAKVRARARPMPRFAPVMTTVPMSFLLWRRSRPRSTDVDLEAHPRAPALEPARDPERTAERLARERLFDGALGDHAPAREQEPVRDEARDLLHVVRDDERRRAAALHEGLEVAEEV